MNNKGMSLGMVAFILALLFPLIPIAIAKQWILLYTFIGFYLVLIGTEIWSIRKFGKTISRRLGELRDREPWKAYFIIGGITVLYVGITWHFLVI